MKILIVSSYLPYPLFSGGHVRLYNIIKELAKYHEIVLVCEKRSHQMKEDIAQVEKFCKEVIVVERKKQWSISNILKSGCSLYPFLITGHTQQVMQVKIKELLEKNTFDIIHVETFYVYQNLPKVTIPTVLVEHNIEYLVYKRFADNALFVLRPLLALDIAKMKYWEEKFWKSATRLVAVSEEEKMLMKRQDVAVVPNGVDIERFKIDDLRFKISKKEKRILFIGDFNWIQNSDAATWLLRDIWPKITLNSQFSTFNIKLWIVGRNIPNSIRNLTKDPNVIFDENAPEETSDIFKNADILLAPIRVGGGTSFKILEAMASGVAVVTTPLGHEGIQAKEGKEIIVGKDTNDFVKKIFSLLENKKEYEILVKSARQCIEKQYAWSTIVEKLEKVYKGAIKTYAEKHN